MGTRMWLDLWSAYGERGGQRSLPPGLRQCRQEGLLQWRSCKSIVHGLVIAFQSFQRDWLLIHDRTSVVAVRAWQYPPNVDILDPWCCIWHLPYFTYLFSSLFQIQLLCNPDKPIFSNLVEQDSGLVTAGNQLGNGTGHFSDEELKTDLFRPMYDIQHVRHLLMHGVEEYNKTHPHIKLALYRVRMVHPIQGWF